MSALPDMSPFGASIFELGTQITRCRDLDRAMVGFVGDWIAEESRLPEPLIEGVMPWGEGYE